MVLVVVEERIEDIVVEAVSWKWFRRIEVMVLGLKLGERGRDGQ